MFLLLIPLFIQFLIYLFIKRMTDELTTQVQEASRYSHHGERVAAKVSRKQAVNVALCCGSYSAEYRLSSSAPAWLIFAAHSTEDWLSPNVDPHNRSHHTACILCVLQFLVSFCYIDQLKSPQSPTSDMLSLLF